MCPSKGIAPDPCPVRLPEALTVAYTRFMLLLERFT